MTEVSLAMALAEWKMVDQGAPTQSVLSNDADGDDDMKKSDVSHVANASQFGSVAILAQVAILLKATFKQLTASQDSFLSMSTSPSKQPPQTAALLVHQNQPQPHDISIGKVHVERSLFALSNTGSLGSGSADVAMCPPVGGLTGDGFTGAGVPAGPGASLEELVRELAVRQNEQVNSLYLPTALQICSDSPASLLKSPTARRSGCAPNRHVLSTSTKTLDSLRPRMDAFRPASVSSIETKSIVSDWTLPKIAGSVGSGSNRRPSQTHTPGESVGSSQASSLPSRRRRQYLKNGTSRMTNL